MVNEEEGKRYGGGGGGIRLWTGPRSPPCRGDAGRLSLVAEEAGEGRERSTALLPPPPRPPRKRLPPRRREGEEARAGLRDRQLCRGPF